LPDEVTPYAKIVTVFVEYRVGLKAFDQLPNKMERKKHATYNAAVYDIHQRLNLVPKYLILA
jgi:hypothetical protein